MSNNSDGKHLVDPEVLQKHKVFINDSRGKIMRFFQTDIPHDVTADTLIAKIVNEAIPIMNHFIYALEILENVVRDIETNNVIEPAPVDKTDVIVPD